MKLHTKYAFQWLRKPTPFHTFIETFRLSLGCWKTKFIPQIVNIPRYSLSNSTRRGCERPQEMEPHKHVSNRKFSEFPALMTGRFGTSNSCSLHSDKNQIVLFFVGCLFLRSSLGYLMTSWPQGQGYSLSFPAISIHGYLSRTNAPQSLRLRFPLRP